MRKIETWHLIAITYLAIALCWGAIWTFLMTDHKVAIAGKEVSHPRLIGGIIMGTTWPISYPVICYQAIRSLFG